jgi:hypothetical protein
MQRTVLPLTNAVIAAVASPAPAVPFSGASIPQSRIFVQADASQTRKVSPSTTRSTRPPNSAALAAGATRASSKKSHLWPYLHDSLVVNALSLLLARSPPIRDHFKPSRNESNNKKECSEYRPIMKATLMIASIRTLPIEEIIVLMVVSIALFAQ